MYFEMVPCPERKEIRQLILDGGGVLLQPGKNPNAVHLVPSSIATIQGPEDVFSANYIRACCGSDKLFPLKEFKIPRAPEFVAIDNADDTKERKLRSVRSRSEYTLGDQIAMAKYVAKAPNVRVRGNQVYKEMATAGVVPGAHSWQSLKEHYLKKILPWKHLYESPDASKLLARNKHAPHDKQDWPRRDSPSDASVIVEDSSDDEAKRQRAPRCEAQKGKGDAETEVVLETESQGDASSSQNHNTPAVCQRGRSKMKRKTLLLSSPCFLSTPTTSTGGSPSRHESRISAPKKKSSGGKSVKSEAAPEKFLPPLRTQSERSPGKTSRAQTQSSPGKQDSGIREGTQTAGKLETIAKRKQKPRSSSRKARSAKRQGTPTDDHAEQEKYTSANVRSVLCTNLPDKLSVLECGEQQSAESSPQKEVHSATFSKHSSGSPRPSQHLQNPNLSASEEQAPCASELRSFRSPVRKERSIGSQAKLSSCLSALLLSESSDVTDAAVHESPRKRASHRRRSSRFSRRKQRRVAAQQSNLNDRLGELVHSESTGDGIIITNALRSSTESVYNTAESEGTTQGTKRTKRSGRSVLSPLKVSDTAALRKNDATLPASEDHFVRSTRWRASYEKKRKSVQGAAHETSGFDSADESLLKRFVEQVSACHVTAMDDCAAQDDATTLSFSSDGGLSDDELTPELGEPSKRDKMDEAQRELSRLLGILRAGKNSSPHATCPPQCTCPLTSRYAQVARAAVSLGAVLAYHGIPLPSGGATHPAVAMALELLLRHLERNADGGSGSK